MLLFRSLLSKTTSLGRTGLPRRHLNLPLTSPTVAPAPGRLVDGRSLRER
jgi:hypothetical protein